MRHGFEVGFDVLVLYWRTCMIPKCRVQTLLLEGSKLSLDRHACTPSSHDSAHESFSFSFAYYPAKNFIEAFWWKGLFMS